VSPDADAPYRSPPGLLGRPCRVGTGIRGTVTAVCERLSGALELEVTWWDHRTRNCESLAAAEVTVDPPDAAPSDGPFGFPFPDGIDC